MSFSGKAYKKLTPLKYPTRKHVRSETPPVYSDYRRYKPFLRTEFEGRCVYCRKSDLDQDPSAFHVEHYRPRNRFASLETTYANLFYSCAACNRFKDTYWSDAVKKRIPNPCDDVMSEHLTFREHVIEKKSLRGAIAIEQLRLNNDHSASYRERLRQNLLMLVDGIVLIRGKKEHADLLRQVIDKAAELTGLPYEQVKKVCKA